MRNVIRLPEGCERGTVSLRWGDSEGADVVLEPHEIVTWWGLGSMRGTEPQVGTNDLGVTVLFEDGRWDFYAWATGVTLHFRPEEKKP